MNKNVYNSKRQNTSFNNNRGKSQKNNFYGDFMKNKKDKDYYADGFKITSKVQKAEKSYSRKGKNKFNGSVDED
jgi:hypothetical protein